MDEGTNLSPGKGNSLAIMGGGGWGLSAVARDSAGAKAERFAVLRHLWMHSMEVPKISWL